MARAIGTSPPDAYEPLYGVDPHTGATIEVFYADPVLAKSFRARGGWFWWTCHSGSLPGAPTGPFPTSYSAYRNVARWIRDSVEPVPNFGNALDSRAKTGLR